MKFKFIILPILSILLIACGTSHEENAEKLTNKMVEQVESAYGDEMFMTLNASLRAKLGMSYHDVTKKCFIESFEKIDSNHDLITKLFLISLAEGDKKVRETINDDKQILEQLMFLSFSFNDCVDKIVEK